MSDINKKERREAKRDGIKPVKNSGRGYQKGDALSRDFLVDYKFNAASFQLTINNWIKLQKQAWQEGQRLPAICIKFANDTKIAIIPWEIFKEALDGTE